MPTFLSWLAALVLGTFSSARSSALPPLAAEDARAACAASPLAEIEELARTATLSVARILESDAAEAADADEATEDDDARWLFLGERGHRVTREQFPEWFAVHDLQRELGIYVGVSDEELERRLVGFRLPEALARGVDQLTRRARSAARRAR